jgi:hypothetical protein
VLSASLPLVEGAMTETRRDVLALGALGALSAALPFDATFSQTQELPNQRKM